MKCSLRFIKLLSNLIIILIICACAKNTDVQKNRKLAQNYYKMCMLEFTDKTAEQALTESIYKKALQHISQAISCYPTAEYVAVKATLLFRLGDFVSSDKAFEYALSLNPEPQIKASILNNYTCLLGQMGKHEKALQIFKELEKNNAYFTPQAAFFNQGRVLFDMHDYNAAKRAFLRAVEKAPDFIDARYCLAMAAFRSNDLTTAKSEVKTILFLDPEHDGALWLKSELGMS